MSLLSHATGGAGPTLQALQRRAAQPATLGEDMEVPFMRVERARVQLGIDAIAPPSPMTWTPAPPSIAGPRLLHVYALGWWVCARLYSTRIMSWGRQHEVRAGGRGPRRLPRTGVTMAATPMAGLLVLPGAPTVERAGPLLPAELMNATPRSRTTSLSTSTKRPWSVWNVGSPKLMLRMSHPARTPWASARIMPWLVSMPSRRVSPILRETI